MDDFHFYNYFIPFFVGEIQKIFPSCHKLYLERINFNYNLQTKIISYIICKIINFLTNNITEGAYKLLINNKCFNKNMATIYHLKWEILSATFKFIKMSHVNKLWIDEHVFALFEEKYSYSMIQSIVIYMAL